MSICAEEKKEPKLVLNNICKNFGGVVAARAWATSSGARPMRSATSFTVASRPSSLPSSSRVRPAASPSSFRLRLTFTVPPSRNSRRISPRMTGTA